MSYIEGFRDAIELFEYSVDRSITKGIKSKHDMISAFDNIISTLYVAKLSLSEAEDKYLDGMLKEMEQDASCENEDLHNLFDDKITEFLDGIFKEVN